MAGKVEHAARELGQHLGGRAIFLALVVVVLLVLYGSVPGGQLPVLLCAFVASRSLWLLAEALRKRWRQADWDAFEAGALEKLRGLSPEDFESEADERGLSPAASPEELCRVIVEDQRGSHTAARPRLELTAEWFGLIAFGLLFPLAFILFTRDIVSMRAGQGYLAAGVAALCLGLYYWPHRWRAAEGIGERRSLWWFLPLAPALILVAVGITEHHPYLDLRRDDRVQLAAARVLELENNIIAGSHADWVFAYAFEVEMSDDLEHALALYRKGLELAPHAPNVSDRIAELERRRDARLGRVGTAVADPRRRAQGLSAEAFAQLPLWSEKGLEAPVPACRIDASLETVAQTTVVIVPLGPVPAEIIDSVATVLREELKLPSCRLSQALPLPEADRIRGVVFGRQWNVATLTRSFYEGALPLPRAPLKYLLLTANDIYGDGTNFVFSSSGQFGAVLSYARYGDPDEEFETVRRRTAKQALGALLKSFDLPPAADPNCVTSYSNGLPQFDAKGNRPTTDTFLKFRARVDALDARWRDERAARIGAG